MIGSSLTLYAWRAPSVGLGARFALLSRETLLEAIRGTKDWTANGLHSPQQVGPKHTGECFRFLQVAVGFLRTGELPHHDHAHVDGIDPVEAGVTLLRCQEAAEAADLVEGSLAIGEDTSGHAERSPSTLFVAREAHAVTMGGPARDCKRARYQRRGGSWPCSTRAGGGGS